MSIPAWPSGVEVIRFLQSFQSPPLDYLLAGFTYLGVELFYFLVLPVLYWCVNKRFAYRLSVVFLTSTFLNSYLKDFFHTSRPSPAEVRVSLPETAGGFAFPSGHAQGTSTFWGYTALVVRKRWFTVLAVLVVGMVMLSRLYFGLHWPVDVLGGLIIGVVFTVVAYRVVEWWDEELAGLAWPAAALLGLLLPCLLLLVSRSGDAVRLVGMLAGMSVGYVLETEFVRFREDASPVRQVLKVVIGLAGLIAVRSGLKAVFPDTSFFVGVRYLLVGLWGSLLAPWLFAWLWPGMAGRRSW